MAIFLWPGLLYLTLWAINDQFTNHLQDNEKNAQKPPKMSQNALSFRLLYYCHPAARLSRV